MYYIMENMLDSLMNIIYCKSTNVSHMQLNKLIAVVLVLRKVI